MSVRLEPFDASVSVRPAGLLVNCEDPTEYADDRLYSRRAQDGPMPPDAGSPSFRSGPSCFAPRQIRAALKSPEQNRRKRVRAAI